MSARQARFGWIGLKGVGSIFALAAVTRGRIARRKPSRLGVGSVSDSRMPYYHWIWQGLVLAIRSANAPCDSSPQVASRPSSDSCR